MASWFDDAIRRETAPLEEKAYQFKSCLLELAARAGDYSAADIRAHVADALEVDIEELEEMYE